MSDEECAACPSTGKQRVLAEMIAGELRDLGLEVRLTDECYVYGRLPANAKREEKIGFIAHMDTSPDAPDENIKPLIAEYTGDPLILNEEERIYLSERDYPCLARYRGQDLVVTDGTTLLGADDKAGCAEIVSAVERIVKEGLPHGDILVAFTPDEEIGRGADLFDVENFGADYAYTVDGGALGEIEFENFNAAHAVVEIEGKSIHPGDAKGKMVNASEVAMFFHAHIPEKETPFHTEGYEGFYHLISMEGTVERAVLKYIIRDHDREKFEERKKFIGEVSGTTAYNYGEAKVKCTVKDSYYNMREKIEPCMYIVERAEKAFAENGVEPIRKPIRGGTDGARLSFMGLPCPNLSTGGENFHSRFEFLPVESLNKMIDVLVTIMTK